MHTDVSDAQVAQYQEDGFLIMEEFLEGDELARWRSAVKEAAQARIENPEEKSNLDDDGYYRSVFTQLSGLRRLSKDVEELLLDPRIGELAARLAGTDGMRLWNDQALFKPPFGNPTAWHFDMPKWSFDDARALTVWVALEDATLENGCMWYVPGSQKTARLESIPLGPNLGAVFEGYPEWLEVDTVPAVLPAGGAVWHGGLTAHGAGANMTPRPRDAMTCAYMPLEVTYNGRRDDFVISEEYEAKLSVGDPLDDEEIFPIVWQRS